MSLCNKSVLQCPTNALRVSCARGIGGRILVHTAVITWPQGPSGPRHHCKALQGLQGQDRRRGCVARSPAPPDCPQPGPGAPGAPRPPPVPNAATATRNYLRRSSLERGASSAWRGALENSVATQSRPTITLVSKGLPTSSLLSWR